jgi:hypothetical protein
MKRRICYLISLHYLSLLFSFSFNFPSFPDSLPFLLFISLLPLSSPLLLYSTSNLISLFHSIHSSPFFYVLLFFSYCLFFSFCLPLFLLIHHPLFPILFFFLLPSPNSSSPYFPHFPSPSPPPFFSYLRVSFHLLFKLVTHSSFLSSPVTPLRIFGGPIWSWCRAGWGSKPQCAHPFPRGHTLYEMMRWSMNSISWR